VVAFGIEFFVGNHQDLLWAGSDAEAATLAVVRVDFGTRILGHFSDLPGRGNGLVKKMELRFYKIAGPGGEVNSEVKCGGEKMPRPGRIHRAGVHI
jgi:hypothetical protein